MKLLDYWNYFDELKHYQVCYLDPNSLKTIWKILTSWKNKLTFNCFTSTLLQKLYASELYKNILVKYKSRSRTYTFSVFWIRLNWRPGFCWLRDLSPTRSPFTCHCFDCYQHTVLILGVPAEYILLYIYDMWTNSKVRKETLIRKIKMVRLMYEINLFIQTFTYPIPDWLRNQFNSWFFISLGWRKLESWKIWHNLNFTSTCFKNYL